MVNMRLVEFRVPQADTVGAVEDMRAVPASPPHPAITIRTRNTSTTGAACASRFARRPTRLRRTRLGWRVLLPEEIDDQGIDDFGAL